MLVRKYLLDHFEEQILAGRKRDLNKFIPLERCICSLAHIELD
jgi:hypothetical protein